MNMKSLIALTALTAAGAASAAVTSENTLCRIEVASGTKNTIVAVPLVKIGSGDAIPANELVLTDNLSEGDKLLHWNTNSKKWEAWAVNASGAWGRLTISDQNSTWVTPEASVTLTRGDAVWVERTQVNGSFYIYGQVTTDAATATTLVRGTAAEPVYTMVGNPLTTDKAVSALTFSGSPAEGDAIMWGDSSAIGGLKKLTYHGSQWGSFVSTQIEIKGQIVNKTTWQASTTDTIPAGQGFWYVSNGGEDTLTVSW